MILFERYRDTPSDINEHIQYMRDLCIELDAKVVVELGVRRGVSTVGFLSAMEHTGGVVWSCDIIPPFVDDEVADHGQWEFMWGDDLELADEAPDCDVLFIDTSHQYIHTLAELCVYAPKARRVVLLHDTQLERPDGAAEWPPFPVRHAALEYVAANPEWEWSEFTHNNGLGVMTRKRTDA